MKIDKFLQGQINTYCESVSKSCKPVVMFPIQDRCVKEVVEIINKYYDKSLLFHMDFLYKDWTTVWIYKKPFMREIINNLPEQPKTIFDHWVLGKVFGFSDEAIEEYLNSPKRSSITPSAET